MYTQELPVEEYDFEALDVALAVPPPREQGTLFPNDAQLDKLGDAEFMAAVTEALPDSIDGLNQGARSALTKFKKRVAPRYERIKAAARLREQLGVDNGRDS